jgi:NAD(P)-dependent dehydrogenase (short-subunit alcohol dehydrogenase family)
VRSPAEPVAESNDAVVISGASSGIGEATALALDALGYQVFAGVRQAADGERLAARASPRLTPVALDVTDPASVGAAADTAALALRSGIALRGLVNNAGVLASGPLEHLPLETLRRQLEVNVVGVLAATRAFLPLLKRSGGRIVNVGSTSGRIAYPMTGAYCASKFALEGLTQVLRLELRGTGVDVSIVEPGVVRTRLWAKALAGETALATALPPSDPYVAALSRRRMMLERFDAAAEPPGAVAAAIVDALRRRRPKRRYVVGFKTRARAAVARALPAPLLDWLRDRAG